MIPNYQTADQYWMTKSDANSVIAMNNSDGNTVVVTRGQVPPGSELTVMQIGTGLTTVTPGPGVTFNGAHAFTGNYQFSLIAQYDYIQLCEVAQDKWRPMGLDGKCVLDAPPTHIGLLVALLVAFALFQIRLLRRKS